MEDKKLSAPQKKSRRKKPAAQRRSLTDPVPDPYRRYKVRHITDPEEIARIQAEANYQPPRLIPPKPVHNLKNWDLYWQRREMRLR
ncbi:MAG: hypothetical protein JXB25_12490 [Deltaproteobacteria bacterium]|nr:hypothetical protein [Deltaproteobacteria bacterium]